MWLAFIFGFLIGALIGIIGLIIHIMTSANDYPGLEDVTPWVYEDDLEYESSKS